MFKTHLDAPDLGALEKKYLTDAIDSNYVSVVGPFVPEFEKKFAQYIGANRAVSVQSGTAAIHIALYELGIGHGDEVIVPSLTFVATVNPVLYVGATPVVVDVDVDTWNMDPKKIQKAITQKTKAIIPVHLYGNPCDLDIIMQIAEEHGLYIIEDATESLGAIYKGKQTGTFGHSGCFSFNGNKLITTGGGGMVVTGDDDKAEHIMFLVNQARDESQGYYHPEMGFNYRMTNIEAALGISQLKRIEDFLTKKRKFNSIYHEALGKLPYIRFQQEPEGGEGSWWLTCIKIERSLDLDKIVKQLLAEGIFTRRVFLPICEMPYMKKYVSSSPSAYEIYNKGLCLPSSVLNMEENIEKAAKIIKDVLSQ